MTSKNQEFKFAIGDTVEAHKPGYGKITGAITGRTYMSQGTPLYFIQSNGRSFKIPQHQIRG